ncbi:hypothetical protein [Parabacteroides sp. AF17-28]|uniref:hypothetical protein n=1 Tax=Parabacteroides sp. AF17-28 TaxID=2292241 RepID=UPI000F00E1FD|nr:hypothetical protein [Parabacteroides sp. AF17-28]RHR53299.1 hypothetical protein DWW90_16665 [Parabacteroides sp. AF17-28]
MGTHTLDNFHEDFEAGRWKVRKFVLPNASDYLWDIENITWAQIGLIDAFGANRFFDEASQMIANSIFLFQKGFFDVAFYSLRQSIELSIGTLYLTANPEKMKEWKKLEPGFESGKMANFLKEHEPVFKEIRAKIPAFFDNIRAVQKKTNKYVHKQGYSSFYTTQRYSWSDHRENKVYLKIVSDFEETLKVAIGAVAMYRLAIDPLPIILMDEELMMRSGDFVTEPYSEEFVNKYIGSENIELYKQTDIYQGFKESIMSHEKQNEAVFNIIHWQIIDRGKFEEITKQIHLLSYTDRLAVVIMMASVKIPQVYIDGCFHYTSDVKATHTDTVIGTSFYEEFFANKGNNNFNIPFKNSSYISRIRICDKYSYIETNTLLDDSEVAILNHIAKIFEEAYLKQEKELKQWLENHK